MQLNDIGADSHKRKAEVQLQSDEKKRIRKDDDADQDFQPYLSILEEWRFRSSQEDLPRDLFERTIKVFENFKDPSGEFGIQFVKALSDEQELRMIGNWMAIHSDPTAVKAYMAMVRCFYCEEDSKISYHNHKYLLPIEVCKANLKIKVDLPTVHKSYADGKRFSGIDFGNYLQGCCTQAYEDGRSYEIRTINRGKFFKVIKEGVETIIISGEGRIKFSNGVTFEGYFKSGDYENGILYTSLYIYTGYFVDNKPSGEGCLRSRLGYSLIGVFSDIGVGLIGIDGKLITANGEENFGKYSFNLRTGKFP